MQLLFHKYFLLFVHLLKYKSIYTYDFYNNYSSYNLLNKKTLNYHSCDVPSPCNLYIFSKKYIFSPFCHNLHINGTVTSDYKEPTLENLDIVAQSNDKLITVKDSYFINAFSVGDTSKFDDDTFGVNGKVNI